MLYQVTPGNEYGIYHRRLIERDGKALTEEKPETVDRRGRSETNPAVDDVVKTLTFEMEGRETAGDRDVIVVRFTPKPDAKPRTRQGKMAKAFKGTIWIDEAAKEVVRLEATAIDNLSYGGVIARLNEGTTRQIVTRSDRWGDLAADIDPPGRSRPSDARPKARSRLLHRVARLRAATWDDLGRLGRLGSPR